MPELPEVEHIARYLSRHLPGRRLERVAWIEPGRYVRHPGVRRFSAALAGSRIEAVGRRGKWLVLSLDGDRRLVVHFKMTGKIRVEPGPPRRGRGVGWSAALDDGRALVYEDQRKFGWVALLDRAGYDALEAALGPEPLEPGFTRAAFRDRLAGRRGRVKPILLDPGFVAGIGNIYADEILHAAGLHPLRTVASLVPAEVARLHRSIRDVLARAVAERSGDPDQERVGAGRRGAARRLTLSVFQRTGEPCPRCRTPIERIVVGARGTHFCPRCQPPGR